MERPRGVSLGGLAWKESAHSNDPLAKAHQTDINQSINQSVSDEGQVFHCLTLLVLLEHNTKTTVDSHTHSKGEMEDSGLQIYKLFIYIIFTPLMLMQPLLMSKLQMELAKRRTQKIRRNSL